MSSDNVFIRQEEYPTMYLYLYHMFLICIDSRGDLTISNCSGIHLFILPSESPFVCRSVSLLVSLSVCMSIHLTIFMPVCLFDNPDLKDYKS